MSLDNIKISPFLVKELYPYSLIDTWVKKNGQLLKKENTTDIKFLGANEKNILILVYEKTQLFLGDADLSFLMNILSACSITMKDIALVNCNTADEAFYEKLIKAFAPDVVLFLGTLPQELGFPVQIPNYQVQQYNNQQYLCAPALQILAGDKEQKKQLWLSLKKIFCIT